MTNIAKAVAYTAEGNDSPNQSEGYTRIGEMAREFGVTLRALRFYEDKGLLTPERIGTSRLYSQTDKLRLQQILLGRKIGFSLSDIKEVLDLDDPHRDRSAGNVEQLKLVLRKSERQMVRLERQQRSIEDAISELKKLIADVTSRLDGGTAFNSAG
ncbi:MerR family DNA-binding transcriptional regulator [Nitratireductor kimnyeongensis]|uniref:MerR family DNA-binding transcriptional regulator n=1 Tax=Nitratireductor kimnyeongensis TaxID=430679 RepID=A0ABW0T7A8_9HYPH|nr:MerR family DNA-binding transcriptional regulator [Nitratireductor kimnyeongensis]QZZ34277.1 MerR family DNA-binding transcriptional regulator [Nitratireductor kimnyeongensis]